MSISISGSGSGLEHIVIDHNDKKIILYSKPVETLLNYDFYHIEEETMEECIHLLADSFSRYNPVHLLAGVTYEDDYIYYTSIVKRSMADKLGFYVYSKEIQKILFVYIMLDLYHYQTVPFAHEYLDKVGTNSGLHKLRALINKLNSCNQIKPTKFGESIFAWCVGINKDYIQNGMLAIGDALVFSYVLKQTNYKDSVGETLVITTEIAYISKGKLLSDIYYDEYVASDGSRPFEMLEKVANVMGLNGTKRAACFYIDLDLMRKSLLTKKNVQISEEFAKSKTPKKVEKTKF